MLGYPRNPGNSGMALACCSLILDPGMEDAGTAELNGLDFFDYLKLLGPWLHEIIPLDGVLRRNTKNKQTTHT